MLETVGSTRGGGTYAGATGADSSRAARDRMASRARPQMPAANLARLRA